jgi:multimeric flavodoxin WrbA
MHLCLESKMNVVVLHGSPRKGMNSDTLADQFLRGLCEQGEHKVTHFYTNEMEIRPCQGCLHCASSPAHNCIIEDDMQEIYRAYKEADLIVWATPMYWGYMTAQLKAVQDRMEALACEGFEGKTFVVLITYRFHYQSTVGMFKRIAPYFNIRLHTVTCCTYDCETGKNLPISACERELEQAYQLGEELGRGQ